MSRQGKRVLVELGDEDDEDDEDEEDEEKEDNLIGESLDDYLDEDSDEYVQPARARSSKYRMVAAVRVSPGAVREDTGESATASVAAVEMGGAYHPASTSADKNPEKTDKRKRKRKEDFTKEQWDAVLASRAKAQQKRVRDAEKLAEYDSLKVELKETKAKLERMEQTVHCLANQKSALDEIKKDVSDLKEIRARQMKQLEKTFDRH